MRYLGEVCYFIQAKVTERVTSRTILVLETARVDGLGMLGLKERISKLIKQKRTKRKLGLRVQVQEKDRQKRNNNEWHDRNIVRSGEKETSVLIRDGMWRPSKGKGALHRTFMSGSDDLPDMQDIISMAMLYHLCAECGLLPALPRASLRLKQLMSQNGC